MNKRVLESLAASGAFDRLEPNRARAFAAIDRILGEAQRQHEATTSGAMEFSFGGGSAQTKLQVPSVDAWVPADKLRREYEAIGFFLSGHPLDDYGAVLQKLNVQLWANFCRSIKSGANAGRVAATVVSRVERRTKTGNKMGIIGLSDPSGHYEAVLFAEGLQQYRDQLEPGAAVLLGLSAEVQGDDVRARIQTVESLDQAAARQQKMLKVFLRDQAPIEPMAKRLDGKGDGEISVVLLLDSGNEVEVKLPGRFKISPQIAGAIKAVPGVVEVQMV